MNKINWVQIICILFLPLFGHAQMTYLHQVGSDRRVALANLDGTFVKFLTPKTEQAYHPEISADGRYVAYSIGTIVPGKKVNVEIQVQDLQTGAIEVWTPKGNQYIHAEFSGDGNYLFFSGPVKVGTKEVQSIQLIHLPSEREKGAHKTNQVKGKTVSYYRPSVEVIPCKNNNGCYFPAISSDGTEVVYHRTEDVSQKTSPKEIVHYSRRTKKKRLLTKVQGHAMVPSMSYDDRYVAYSAIENGNWDIHVYDLLKNTDRKITNNKQREFTPVFAPDGSIYYTHIDSSAGGFELDIYRMDRKQVFGTQKAQAKAFISKPSVMEYVPSFSGDGAIEIQQMPDLPNPQRSSFGAIYHNGKIYAAGGHQGPEHRYPAWSFVDRLDIYDEAVGKWQPSAKLSVPRHGFQIAAHGNYIYAFGGFAFSAAHKPQWHSLDIIERYDISKDRWEVLPERLPRRRSSNIVAKVGDKAYLIGGWDSTPKFAGDKDGNFHSEIDVFDFNTEKVSIHKSSLKEKRRAFAAVVVDEEIILLGGISEGASHFDWIDNVTGFDPKRGTFVEYAPLPFATFAPGAGYLNGEIFLFGGMNSSLSYQSTIYRYDFHGKKEWINTGRFLQEKKGFPQVVNVLSSNALGILGGHTYKLLPNGKVLDTPVSTFEMFFAN